MCILVIALVILTPARSQESKDVRLLLSSSKGSAEQIYDTVFSNPKIDMATKAALKKMPEDVGLIIRAAADKDVPDYYVTGIKVNTDVLNSWAKKKLDNQGIKAVMNVADDYSAKAVVITNSAKNGRNPFSKVKVQVNTLNGANPADKYRVMCAPAADPEDKNRHITFAQLSTPTYEDLMPGLYYFWAQMPKDSSKNGVKVRVPVTDNGKGMREPPIDVQVPTN